MMYRQLTEHEIARLMAQGCRCDQWQALEVADGFVPDHVCDTYFSGRVRMDVFDGMADLGGGVMAPAGIRHATVADCSIGRNACILGVRRYLSQCLVEEGAVIADVGAISATRGQSEIGPHARVVQCGSLCNVRIAAGLYLENVPLLSDVSLSPFSAGPSRPAAPATGELPAAVPEQEPASWDIMPAVSEAPAPPAVQPSADPAPSASKPFQASLFESLDDTSRPVLADTLQMGYSPLNEKFATGTTPLADVLQDRSLARLEDGIGLNDRFLFTRELFKSNPHLYKECIKKIDACSSMEEASAYISTAFHWPSTSGTAKKFLNLIHRRFSSHE